jgi:hypothetical protein
VYYRNIIDRFPLIPDFLAQRLAKANCARAERLERLKVTKRVNMLALKETKTTALSDPVVSGHNDGHIQASHIKSPPKLQENKSGSLPRSRQFPRAKPFQRVSLRSMADTSPPSRESSPRVRRSRIRDSHGAVESSTNSQPKRKADSACKFEELPAKRRTLSCRECIRKKIRCSRERPSCLHCRTKGTSCLYLEGLRRPFPLPEKPPRPQRRSSSVCSGSSGVNDSLRGTPTHDPLEQNPVFTMAPGSHSSNESHGSMELSPQLYLPRPPIGSPRAKWIQPLSFDCDICGGSVTVNSRREWK